MGRRVLVTRPEPGASATATRLRDAGFEPIILPLSQTQALPVDLATIPATVDAVAITSANALLHAPRELIASLADKRCFAVGRKTATAARDAGFCNVVAGPGNAGGLADLIAAELMVEAQIAYLAGRVRLPDFELRLAQSGYRAFVIETYDTHFAVNSNALGSLDGAVDAVLLYSVKAAEAFSLVVAGNSGLAGSRCFCLSARVADALQGVERERIFVPPAPAEDALMELLAAVCPPAS
jgi:uroporphyrinogen-III synthase